MADRTITVSLDFTANTSSAENSLRALQTSLQNISNLGNLNSGNLKISKEILEASEAAIQLRSHLQAAMDVKTGQLNLSKLDSELSKSGMKLSDYASKLAAIGPEGQRAFMQMTNAIIASQTPLRQTNNLVNKLWDSLKRTAGWQISSTVIHGFMGAIQSAYGYAQDLNQSLNNIRIVTGASTDEMARFADKANKAAKALSSTTTDYTDAALIYYQQGIRDEDEIAQRTDTTIKLANVSRQSAEEVSSQMTAIWNNFADGSQNLEYYADVITKLGATTAASSSEIAGGMEKFAAVADTVGLSYEYAAASLATIVATTRQSEDTVGTGLRTIFSRLEGLKLGDTLEDGTDLNKYSQALETVGVNIKDASGNLKDMDTILDETAAKWDTLDQAQKVAFATTVGGVRQYTNLIALLDNWEMMEENVATARGSEGTLQEQQEIYAESWEAAQKRVRAAAESLYQDLLDDKFFIGLTNTAGKFLEVLDKIIDGVGGLGTILPGLIILIDKLFGSKIQAGAKVLYDNIRMTTAAGQADRIKQDQITRQNFIDAAKSSLTMNDQSNTGQTVSQEYGKVLDLQQKLNNNTQRLTQEEQKIAQMYIDRQQQLAENNIEYAKSVDLAKEQQSLLVESAIEESPFVDIDATDMIKSIPKENQSSFISSLANYQDISSQGLITTESLESTLQIFKELGIVEQEATINSENFIETFFKFHEAENNVNLLAEEAFPRLIAKYSEATEAQQMMVNATNDLKIGAVNIEQLEGYMDPLIKKMKQLGVDTTEVENALIQFKNGEGSIEQIQKALEITRKSTRQFANDLKNSLQQMNVSSEYIDKIYQAVLHAADGFTELQKRIVLSSQSFQIAETAFSKFTGILKSSLSGFSSFVQGASTAVMGVSMLKNAIETMNNPDVSGWEKFSSVIISLGMGIPMVMNALNGFASGLSALLGVQDALTASTILLNTEQLANASITELQALGLTKESAAALKDLIAKKALKGETAQLTIAELIESGVIKGNIITRIAENIQKWLGVEATIALKIATLGFVGAAILAVGAIALVIAKLIDQTNAEKQAEEANKKVNEAYKERIEILDKTKTAAEEVTKAFDEMTAATERYGNARKALEGMSKETEAYRDKVKEANDAARKLIETMGLTLGKGYDISNGEYIINTNSGEYKTAYKNQQERAQMAEQVSAGVDYQKARAYQDKVEGQTITIGEQSHVGTIQHGDSTIWAGSTEERTMVDQAAFNIGQATMKGLSKGFQESGLADPEAYVRQLYNNKELTGELAGKNLTSDNISQIANQITAIQDAQKSLFSAYEGQIVNAAMSTNPNMTPYLTTEMIQSTLGKSIYSNGEDFDKAVQAKVDQEGYVEKTIKDLFPNGYEMTEDQKDRGLNQSDAEKEVVTARAAGEIAQEYIKQALPELKASAQQAVLDNATQTAYIKDLPTEEEFALDHPDLDNIEEEYNSKIANAYETAQEAFAKLLDSDTIINYAKNQASGDSEEYAAEYDTAKEKASDTRDWDFQDWENENLVEQFIKEKEAAGYAKEEIYEYVQAMKDLSMTEEEVAQQTERRNALMNEAQQYGIDPEELSNYIDAFEDYNMELAQGEGTLTATDQAAEQAALRYARLNKGVQDVAKNTDDYVAVLKASKKATDAVSKANIKNEDSYKDLRKSLANILNTSEDLVDIDFMQNLNPADLEALAKGGDAAAAALDRIQSQFIETQAKAAGFSEGLTSALQQVNTAAEGIDLTQILTDEQVNELITKTWAISSSMEDFQNRIKGMDLSLDITPLTESMRAAAEASLQEGEVIVDAFSFDGQPVTSEASATSTTEEMGYTVDYIPGSRVPAPAAVLTDADSETATPVDAYYTPVTKKVTFTPEKEEATTTEPIVAYKMSNGHHAAGGNIAPPVSKGKSGGGGGGGGGGGSKKSKDAPKADRGARYHNVTRRQSNVSRQQTENNRRKDRAFGKAQVELAREDLEIQKKKIELQEEYTKEISKNLKEDREDMKKQFEALQLPINFKFDEDGEIENYQEIIDALFEKEKALVEQYNSGGLDDEAFDEAKKKLDEAKETLGNYEETLEKQKDELQTLSEYMEELSDKALELTQIKFDLNMSIIEDQLEWLDYSLSEIEDDAYSAAKAIALMGEQTSQYLKQGDITRAAISEILGRHGVNSIEELNGLSDSQIEALGFNKDEIDALNDYRSQLYESNQALLEMRRTITDKILDTFDTFNEKVSESYEEFDNYNDILEKYTDIVDLLGTKTDAATKRLVKTLRDTQLQNLRNQSVSAKEIYEGALANYNLAEKQYNDAVARYGANSIEAQQMEEIMKQAADARDDAYSNWLDAYQASLEKAREIYEAEMEELQKDFERSLTGIYGTFDLFDAAYERAKELKDNYLPEYEKIYELNKLNRDIQKEIDNSSSLRDKKALRQLQDEINRKQEAGVQLSKYEVEEMRKKFELEQARMNLEDARNSKSEVRLTRDQNGNWGYVYTASEDKVADAEQKYEDALYQYQKLSDDYITDLDEKIKDLTKNTQERLDEVREALEEGLIDIDQAEQQKQDILNNFYAQQSYLISQFKGATDSLASSLGLMDELYGQQAELVDTLPETTFGQVSSVGSMEEWAAKSSEEILKYAEESAKAYERLQTTNQEIADQNKLNLSDIETATNNVAKSSEKTQQKVSETVQALADSFKSTMGALAIWDQTYATTIQNAINQNKLFIDSLNTVIAKLGLIASYEMKDLYDYIDYLSAKGAKGETITEAEWKKLDEIRQKYAVNYSKESMAPFDTGGYTGEWGDEGKIAILHEKEYVLNADLTARFFDALKTFSLVDQFVNTENQIQQQQLQIETLEALSNYIDQLADRMNTTTINPNDFSTSLFNSGNQQLEQNVHIEANFPNVTQSSEIEMAFDNLVNKASQYINRKNMSSMTFQDSYLSPV